MSTQRSECTDFHSDLEAVLPRLRAYARSLTRDADSADDLVQETVAKALAGQNSYQQGTFFTAWLFRIQRNEFISGMRRQRHCLPFDDTFSDTLSCPPRQDTCLAMKDLAEAFGKLSRDHREALMLAVVDGQPYQLIAENAGVAVGTIKSRVSRARNTLERLMAGGSVAGSRNRPDSVAIRPQ